MKLETFFEKFDLFADAPDAVDELRKIILHLAVHGALVDQSDDDEPAKVALQRLSGRKLAFLDSEELPKAWESVALGELVVLQKGKKPSSLNTEGVGLPYLDIAALERGELRQFTEDDKCPRAASEDLVIVCDGSRSGLVLDGVDGVLGSTVSKIGYLGFIRDYLKLFLCSLYDDLNGAKKGAAIPHLNIPRFLAIPAPVPPLAEQKRIVAKVDELMALCDRLEAQQQDRESRERDLARAALARFTEAPTPANLDLLFHQSFAVPPADLRKSILTLAVQGKLVPQDPNDEPASEFVRRLQVKRKDFYEAEVIRARREGIRPPRPPRNGFVPHVDEEGQDIPYTWCVTRVGDVSECLDYLRVPVNKGERLAASGTVPYYGANGQVGWIDKHLFDEDLVLVVEDETFIGRIKPFSYVVRGKTWVNNHAHVLRPLGGMTADFLNLVLCRYPFIPLTSGTTNRRKLTQPSLMDAEISLPPLAEQMRIVAKVDELMALVDQLEVQQAAARTTAEKLLEAAVAELTVA